MHQLPFPRSLADRRKYIADAQAQAQAAFDADLPDAQARVSAIHARKRIALESLDRDATAHELSLADQWAVDAHGPQSELRKALKAWCADDTRSNAAAVGREVRALANRYTLELSGAPPPATVALAWLANLYEVEPRLARVCANTFEGCGWLSTSTQILERSADVLRSASSEGEINAAAINALLLKLEAGMQDLVGRTKAAGTPSPSDHAVIAALLSSGRPSEYVVRFAAALKLPKTAA